MTDTVTVTLFHPTGQAELDLIRAAEWRAFPPRLPEQPIFYPVLNEEYATQIARDWNTRDDGVGYVVRFQVEMELLARYSVQTAGARTHQEYWIPAEELDEFNRHIVGVIEVIASSQSTASNANLAELAFVLLVEDEWPPVSVECMPADRIGEFIYRPLNPPLFVKGLSVGDLVEVEFDGDRMVVAWKILSPSAHSTVWLARLRQKHDIESMLQALRDLGCATVAAPNLGCYAVDIPEAVAMEDVDLVLESADEESVAIAFPSFRHPE